jgi:hypothetical protein
MNMRSFLKNGLFPKLGISVVLSLTTLSCVKLPTKPIMPQSDIQGSIPLIDRTWTASELIAKDTAKIKQNSAGYYYADDRSFTPAKLDTMKVSPQAGSNRVALGKVSLTGLPPVSQNYTMTSFGIPSGTIPPTPPGPVFPAYSIALKGIVLPTNSQFDWMAIDTGNVTLSVTNTMPLQVTFPLGIRLKNNAVSPSDTSTVLFFNLGTIDSGKTKSITLPLTKRIMYSALQTDSVKFTTNARNGPFTINSTDGISFTFSSGSFTVDSAKAIVPSTPLAAIHDSLITIDPTAVLQQATFSRGLFSASLVNNTGLSVGAVLKFSNFVSTKPSKDTLAVNQIIPPHGSYTINVALDTIQLVNGNPAASSTTMRFSASISTVNSGGAKTVFTSNDFVGASFTPQQQFVVKSLTGIMNPLNVNVNTGVALAGLGDASSRFSGSFNFDSIQFVLKVGLSSGFPVSQNLTLFAVNHKVSPARMDSMPIPPSIIYPGLSTPGIITLNNSVGLSTFLSKAVLADTMYARGSLVVNPAATSGTIYDTTKVYPSMSMYIPLKLGLVGGQYVDVTPIQGTFDSAFVADVQSGSIYMTITNHLPLGVSFRAAFLGLSSITHRPDTLLTLPLSPPQGQIYSIGGAHVNTAGAADQATTSRIQITLVGPQLDMLAASDSVYVKLLIGTSGSAGPPLQAVRINGTDYFRMQASANMVYTLKEKNK